MSLETKKEALERIWAAHAFVMENRGSTFQPTMCWHDATGRQQAVALFQGNEKTIGLYVRSAFLNVISRTRPPTEWISVASRVEMNRRQERFSILAVNLPDAECWGTMVAYATSEGRAQLDDDSWEQMRFSRLGGLIPEAIVEGLLEREFLDKREEADWKHLVEVIGDGMAEQVFATGLVFQPWGIIEVDIETK